jgi:mRNA interferase MazF
VVARKVFVPQRGDLIWLDFDPRAGHEQAGRRPALVLSAASYNDKTSLALVCPVTSQVKGYPFEVEIPPGSKVRGAVLADHVKSLDWRARRAERIARLPEQQLSAVVRLIATLVAG